MHRARSGNTVAVEPEECFAKPKTAAQATLNRQEPCHGALSTHRTHAIVAFSDEQHSENVTVVLLDQMEHTHDK